MDQHVRTQFKLSTTVSLNVKRQIMSMNEMCTYFIILILTTPHNDKIIIIREEW